jgi:hypothetical protein
LRGISVAPVVFINGSQFSNLNAHVNTLGKKSLDG